MSYGAPSAIGRPWKSAPYQVATPPMTFSERVPRLEASKRSSSADARPKELNKQTITRQSAGRNRFSKGRCLRGSLAARPWGGGRGSGGGVPARAERHPPPG